MSEKETVGTEGEGSVQPSPDWQSPMETVQLGNDDGPDMTPSPARCRIGLHHWATHQSEDGRAYRTCTICGQDEYSPPLFVGLDPHHR